MKKYFNYFLVVALGATALWACQREVVFEDENTLPESRDITKVRVNLGLDTKAQFSDELGITWEAGDEIRFWGNTGQTTATLAAADITDGNRASFDIEIPNVVNESPKGVFQYHWSTRNTAEWDFGEVEHKTSPNATLAGGILTVTQAQAGVMNKAFLFMQTTPGPDWGTVIPQATSTPVEITLQMQIVGTIFRILPYTETYNDEVVQSVTLSSNGSQNLGGTVAYNYAEGTYRDAQTINWLAYNKATVNLGTGFALTSVTSREASKGIYFALSATESSHNLNGYNIEVVTDKAKYYYSTTKSVAVSENAVKNIFLKLENADTREDLTVVKGTYNFWGSIAEGQNFECNANAQNNWGLGYWVVSTLDAGATDRVTVEANAHPEYYVAQFECIDDATSAAADWLTVGYRPNDTWWAANVQANPTSTARSATVTVTYPDNNNGYTVESGFKTRTIHISQKGLATVTPVLGNLSASTVPAAGGSVTATIDLQIDGVAATDAQFNEYISEVTFAADNCSYSRDGHTLTITVGVNPKTEARTATLTASANGGNDSVSVTQEAASSAMAITFSYGFSGWQDGTRSFSRSFDAEAHSQPDWMIVLTNLRISTTNDVPTAADMPDLIKYAFQLTQAEYDAFAEFVQLSYEIGAGETKIWFQGVTANTGSSKRVFDKWFKTSDLSADYVHVTITQSKNYPAGTNYWPDLTVNTANSYYGPGWVATTFPAITKGANNSSYAFTIPSACNERWQCQFKLETDLPKLDAAKTYTFSCTVNCSETNVAHIQLMTAGIGYPVDDDVAVEAGVAKNFSKDFTGFALVNSTLIFDFGFAPANTDVTITNISIAEKL